VVDLDKLKSGELLKRAKRVFAQRKKYQKLFTQRKQEITMKEHKFLQVAMLS
jgi:hypothetical protein